MKAKLKKCPFCGGNPLPEPDKVLRDGYGRYKSDPDAYAYSIRCMCCAAEGGWAKSESTAAFNWNMRPVRSRGRRGG